MHVEIQVALNFFISFLYNKLPRRRVNQFGEELEKALKIKFEGHWYPEKPFKGSAFRCIKTAPPLDPVFEIAAHECGMSMADIQENLPEELSIWIDPGEVSYRLGEKGCVKILYSESESSEDRADREIYRTFNPEAQCFKPIDSVASQLGSMSISSGSSSSSPYGNSPSPTYKSSTTSPINGFLAKSTAPLTFTTATFAQTKFGSTKLKTSGKRSHRMSPTEFSSYIKQRALIQQQQQLSHHHPHHPHHTPTSAAAMYPNSAVVNSVPPQRPRSLSPTPSTSSVSGLAPQQQQQQQQQQGSQQQQQQQMDASSFLLLASTASQHQQPSSQQYAASPSQPHFSPQQTRPNSGVFESVNGYLSDIFAPSPAGLTSNNTSKVSQHLPVGNMATTNANALSIFFDNKAILNNGNATNASGINFNLAGDANSKVYGGMESINFNVGAMSYPNQHLLMAN